MKFTHHLKISSMALFCAMTLSTQVHAEAQKQKTANSTGVLSLENTDEGSQTIVHKEASLSVKPECKTDMVASTAPSLAMGGNISKSEARFLPRAECQPIEDKTEPQFQEAEVRLSGYGRFGLDYNDANESNSDKESNITSRLRLTFTGGGDRIKSSQAGYGVSIVPGQERFAGQTDDRLDGYNFGAWAKWRSNAIIKDGVYIFSGNYAEADGSSEAQIGNGTDNVGIVYHDFAPSGSTGVNIGSSGLDVRTNSITSRLRIQFDMSTETDGGVTFGARLRNQVAVGAGARFTNTEHTASVTTPTFNDISASSIQKLDENFYYINGYSTLSFEPDGDRQGGFGLYLTPRVEAGYRDASLDSRQINICGLCGAADQNFNININNDDNGFYYDLSFSADLAYHMTDKLSVGISGNVGWRNKTARIFNPETGDDLFIRNMPTHLDTESEYRDGINAWFSANF